MFDRSRHHYDPTARALGGAALLAALLAMVFAMSGMGEAARSPKPLPGPSATPRKYGILRLDAHKRFPASAIPTVAEAQDARRLSGTKLSALVLACPRGTVDLGTWCLDETTQGIPVAETGKNDFIYASRTCVGAGGYLPSAAQLVGAAPKVRLSSTLDDQESGALIDVDPTVGLKDHREMSSSLFTVSAGSSAAGSEGVSNGSRGDPRDGEPDPLPAPADPTPSTLDYVTVYDNHNQGGFAGGESVTTPERFRCAYDKAQPASSSPGSADDGG